ncbi:DUF2937 family protein, partial [Rhizobiaceae bacterium]|nr:DUF2937 family protein [Rhizobiaceae bacterium]
PLMQRRSHSMEDTIARADALETQAARIEQVSPMARPAVVLSYPDPALMAGTWEKFEPALPVNGAGLLWGAFGGIIGWLFAVLFGKALPAKDRKRVVIR